MTDQTGAPAGSDAAPAIADTSEISLEQARSMIDAQLEEPDKPEAGADEATPDPKLSQDNAEPETDPGDADETPADDPEETLPPIERPRSWAKELDDEWASYPREAQEKIAKREQERDSALRRSQNEAADIRKAAEAERDKATQARQAYEAKLPAIEQALLDVQARDYPDIKNMSDVERLAAEDPFRYLQWQAHQQKLQAINYEKTQADQRQSGERQTKWSEFIQTENAKVAELHPETADPKTKAELQQKAVALLEEKGFTQSELTALANGTEKISVFDHRLQSLVLDGVKYREAKAAPPKAITKPVPPVQRPGVAAPKGATDSAQIQALEAKLNKTGSEKDAWALMEARLKSSSRRAS